VRFALASGYPLHHLHGIPFHFMPFGGSATIPLAKTRRLFSCKNAAIINCFLYICEGYIILIFIFKAFFAPRSGSDAEG
jgi:hypothetical protein